MARSSRTGSRLSRVVPNTVAILFSIVWVFPVYWMINTALKPRQEAMTVTPVFFPKDITLKNFAVALTQPAFLVDLRNSITVVICALVVAMPLAFLAAAGLSRFVFRGRRFILVLILAVQMLPGTAVLIPLFLIFNRLGLLGTYPGLILAYIGSALPFSIWVLRGFFLAVPREIEEAARVDGAGTWRVLWHILFPLVSPGLIAASVFSFISSWNDYLIAYTFMKEQDRYTLPVWLASFEGNPMMGTGNDYVSQMAASVVFSLPIVLFFLLVQRNLVTGMTAGAVRG